MKKKLLLIATLMTSGVVFSQVGINTDSPSTTLDVIGKPNTVTAADGIIAPRLTGDQLKAKDAAYSEVQNASIVYATSAVGGTPAGKTINVTAPGYYYYSQPTSSVAGIWVAFNSSATSGMQPWNLENSTTPATSNTQNIYQNGNVGIGNFSSGVPVSKLDVRGAVRGGGRHPNELNGTWVIGNNSAAFGTSSTAEGSSSFAAGQDAHGKALQSIALGSSVFANSNQSIAIGNGSAVSQNNSIVIGNNSNILNNATDSNSFLLGNENNIFQGSNSSVFGQGNIAGGNYSITVGNNSSNLGNYTSVFGQNNTAVTSSTSEYSVALGNFNQLAAPSSLAMGFSNLTNGQNALAIGSQTTAKGQYSVTLGSNLVSNSYSEIVLGSNNSITSTDAANWIPTEPIFQLGNGPSFGNNSNAVTVLKNGNMGIGNENQALNPVNKLVVGSGNVQIINLPSISGATSDKIVVADTGGVLRTINFSQLTQAIPQYANDAAADADSGLPSGGFYKITGNRAVYQKP
ncbi:hypothetical protein [Chryseobacterium sp. GP-SGM7]|uniref:hypothetical protein n=1 Tax=Chryseobacterium sp. GP-SGM7 TaxID=3411323 RepID=UPI003B9593D4